MGAHAAPCGPAALGGAGCALCQHWVWALGWCRVPTWPQGDGLVPSEPPPLPPRMGGTGCVGALCVVWVHRRLLHACREMLYCTMLGHHPGGGHHPWALLHAQGRRWGKANPPMRLHRAPRPTGGGEWGWGEQGQQAVGRAGCAQCNQSLHPGWRMKKRRRTMDGNRGGSGVREAPNGGGGGLTSGL